MDFFRARYVIPASDAVVGKTDGDGPVFTVAPSDLTFLLHECIRCFWMKVVAGRRRAQSPMPGVFTRLDRLQRAFFDGRRTSEVSPLLPPGRLDCSDLKVCSKPLVLAGAGPRLRIRGAIDALVTFDDGTFGIIDFKTSSPSESSQIHYGLQLHAYAIALEQADWLHPTHSPITQLGLLCFDPGELHRAAADDRLAYRVDVSWIPIEQDRPAFTSFLEQVLLILSNPEPPEPGPDCRWCQWTAAQRS